MASICSGSTLNFENGMVTTHGKFTLLVLLAFDFSFILHCNNSNPRNVMVLVAAAGPGMNIVLALIAALTIYLVGHLPDIAAQWLAENLKNALIIVILAVFNLLPLSPFQVPR
jgi:uncharacterized membrane protein SirB2